MELTVLRGRIHPRIAAAGPTRIVKTNYCRAEAINTADLRLHPAARGNWTLNVAYSARVVCHGDLQDGAWQAPVFFNNPLMRAQLRRIDKQPPYPLGFNYFLGQNPISQYQTPTAFFAVIGVDHFLRQFDIGAQSRGFTEEV